MTSSQQTVVGLAVAFLAATAFYEAHQASRGREQAQTLRDQQASLAGQVRQLRRERDAATNQVARLMAENRQLKSKSSQTELLKLRQELDALRPLREQVASLQKMASQETAGLGEWTLLELRNAGRATPQDAVQTFFWASAIKDASEAASSLVPDRNDPPSEEQVAEFATHQLGDAESIGFQKLRVLSQNVVSPDEVQLEVQMQVENEGLGGEVGMSRMLTLRNVGGEWRFVVSPVRGSDGQVTGVDFAGKPPSR